MSGFTDSAAGLLEQASEQMDPAGAVAIQNAIPVVDLEGLRQVVVTARGIVAQAGGKPMAELESFFAAVTSAIDSLQAKLATVQEEAGDLIRAMQAAHEECRIQSASYWGTAGRS